MVLSKPRTACSALLSWTAIAASALLGSSPALAQSDASAFSADSTDLVAQAGVESTAPSDAKKKEFEIENVVVTARKRNERIQRIPVSISAWDGMELEEFNVGRISDAGVLIPNGDFTGESGGSRLQIRGIAESDPNPAVDPAVGTYVDGVYEPRAAAGEQPLYDVERFEVLRGPQGTIFGKNSLGGAINVTTTMPKFERGGDVSVKVGNYHLFESRAGVNLPISDKLTTRFSLATNSRDGFQKNTNGNDLEDDGLLAGRFKLLYFPTESVEVLLGFDQAKENKSASGGRCKLTDGSQSTGLKAALFALDYQNMCGAIGASDNARRTATTGSNGDDIDTMGTLGRVTVALSPNTTFQSITAFRQLENNLDFDGDFTALNGFRETLDLDQRQVSQEFQINSSALDGRLEFVLGLYGFREKSNTRGIDGVFTEVTAADVVNPFFITGDPATDAQITAGLLRGAREDNELTIRNQTYSTFGQLRYNLTPELQFTGGVRLEEDRRRLKRIVTTLTDGGCATSGGMAVPIGTICSFYDRSDRFSDFTPSAQLTYKFSDETIAYGSYSTGFKAGGFNPRSLTNDLGPVAGVPAAIEAINIDPAKLTTYEVGAKTTFADGQFLINASAFYSIFEGIQVLSVSQVTPAVLAPSFGNQADSRVSGLELTTVAIPLANLKLGANLGLLDDHYTRYQEPVLAPGQPFIKVGNGRLPFTSHYQYRLSADYGVETPFGQLTAGTAWSVRGKQFFDPENSRELAQGSFGLLSAKLVLELADGVTEVALVGTNLLDRDYTTFGFNLTNLFGSAGTFTGPPRAYGLQVRRTF